MPKFTHKTDFKNSGASVVLVWYLKQVNSLIGGSFFSDNKQLSDYYAIILVSLPLGGYVDEVVNSQAVYQRFKNDVHFIRCHTFAVIHSRNAEGFCQIIITTIFDMYILKHS